MKTNQRIKELCARMAQAGMDAALLTHPRDVLYYAGTARPAALFVAPHSAILFIRRGLEYARREATIERVEPMTGFSSITAAAAELELRRGVLGVALDVTPAQLYLRVTDAFPNWKIQDISSLVLEQRITKDEGEIASTREAAAIADAGHEALPYFAKPGMSELALAAEIERTIRLAGHGGYQQLRYPEARGGGILLMSGDNLSVRGGHGLVVTGAGLSPGTPYGPSHRVMQSGDIIVVDIGSTYGGYTADESRTFVLGKATEAQEALFAVTLATEKAVLKALRPGAKIAEIYETAQSIVDQGAPPYFAPGSLTLPGFIGHGIGLELDEPPVLWPREKSSLQEGMVLAIEVEVSAPEAGTMVKLEDTILVDADGYEMLTVAPRELIEVGL